MLFHWPLHLLHQFTNRASILIVVFWRVISKSVSLIGDNSSIESLNRLKVGVFRFYGFRFRWGHVKVKKFKIEEPPIECEKLGPLNELLYKLEDLSCFLFWSFRCIMSTPSASFSLNSVTSHICRICFCPMSTTKMREIVAMFRYFCTFYASAQ